ncbi:MAG TPA: adenylate/guanylate cyclase domain-containing protein [Thermoanaerobaculia bacterium]|nr:adenylate/guanylate cyclase domain-containing protein [Thermoanaerobaculia bacterium]
MDCPHCHFDNPQAMKFCGQCGARLGTACPSCGAQARPGFKFCGECGATLPGSDAAAPPPPPAAVTALPTHAAASPAGYTPPHLRDQVLQTRTAVEGERKQVTVLFCDLVSSTAIADRLGPEVMHGLLSEFFELALSEVHRYGGTVNQFLGDGFMALFGAPVAHEDHARRAVLAALGVQRLLRHHGVEPAARHGIEVAVRMGLNTGLVVVGGIGDRLRMDYTAIGDTTNLAARLQQLAPPGAILASEATARLIQGDVRLEALPPLAVKGKSEPIAAFRVAGLGPRRPDDAVLSAGRLSPFVGRERELAVLGELLEQAARGDGQVVGIAGEAGSGKSRLLHEFRLRTWATAAFRLAGRCLSFGGGVPYLPLVHLLQGAWQIESGDDPVEVVRKARAGLADVFGAGDSASPAHLWRLLGVRAGDEDERAAIAEPAAPAPPRPPDDPGTAEGGTTARALQSRTFAALRQWICGAGRGGLVIVEIEDLHWADATSEEFLSYLVEGLTGMPVLLLLTYRPGYRAQWMDKSYATQIAMRRLGDRESEQVVHSALALASVPAELSRLILAKAEGNPFFIEELTRTLLERGSWAEAAVPDTIQGVLMARIDRLPEEHKRLLQAASVIGRELPHRLLERLWEGPSPIEPLLRDLQRWEFVYELPAAREPASLFKHGLTQEVVYQSLLTARRQALHGAAGRALETLFEGRLEQAYAGLARHFSQSGESERALTYLTLVAAQAAAGYAHAEAAQALYAALEHAEQLPPARRDREALEVVRRLAASLLPLARFREALDLLARHHGRLAAIDDPELAGAIEFWLALYHSYLGDRRSAEEAALRAGARARESGDLATEGKALYVLARDGFVSGRFAAAIASGREAVALLARAGERWWRGQALWAIGFNQYALGRWDEALATMAEAHAIGEELEDPRLDTSWSVGYFQASMGEVDAGIATCRRGLERSRDPLNTAAAQGFLGYAELEQGNLGAAREALETAVAALEAAGFEQLEGWLCTFLAEVESAEGHTDEARRRAGRALSVAEATGFGYGRGLALRALGRIADAAGDLPAAAAHLRTALGVFGGLDAAMEAARTRLDLAAWAGRAGDAATAAAELRAAAATLAELRLDRLAERARLLAVELGVDLSGHPALTAAAAVRL